MRKLYTLHTEPLNEFASKVAVMIKNTNKGLYDLCGLVFKTESHFRKSFGTEGLKEFQTEIGKRIAPMNQGREVEGRSVIHWFKIGEMIDPASIEAFGNCGSVKSLRFIAGAKENKLTRTMKNEIVVAIGKAGGVYSDRDLEELGKFAKDPANKNLSATQIVEKRGPGCFKEAKKETGEPTPHEEVFEELGTLYTARTGKVAQNQAVLSKYLKNTVIPQAKQWAAQEAAKAAKAAK